MFGKIPFNTLTPCPLRLRVYCSPSSQNWTFVKFPNPLAVAVTLTVPLTVAPFVGLVSVMTGAAQALLCVAFASRNAIPLMTQPAVLV